MEEDIIKDGNIYIPVDVAARSLNRTRQYLMHLCRRSDIRGLQIDGKWFVDSKQVTEFISNREAIRSKQYAAIRVQRAAEYHAHQQSVILHVAPDALRLPVIRPAPMYPMVRTAIAAVLIGSIALTAYASDQKAGQRMASAMPHIPGIEQVLTGVEVSDTQIAAAAQTADAVSVAAHIAQVWAHAIDGVFAAFGSSPKIVSNTIPATVPSAVVAATSTPPSVINQTIVQQPVIEHTIETRTVVTEAAPSTGISEDSLDTKLQQLENKLSERMYSLSAANSTSIAQTYNVVSQTSAINQLNNTSISNPTISGGSITNASISGSSLSIGGTATSSFGSSIDIAAGCFSVGGVCIGSNAGTSNVSTSTANTWSAIQIFSAGAQFGGVSSTTVDSNGNIALGGTISGAGLSACSGSGDKLLWDATTQQFTCGVDAGGSGSGISALHAQYSTAQVGATQTFATTTDTNIGLTIISAGNIHTFSPTWIGTLGVNRGGIGTSTAPTFGQVLVGNGSGGYNLVATSTLGITSIPTWGSITGTLSNQTDLQNALNAKLSLTSWYATTTDGLAQGSTNKYYSTNLFAASLAGTTTDALPQGSTNQYFSITGVNNVINASTTIPKTSLANIWNPLQTFTNGFISNASSTVAGNFTTTGAIFTSLGTPAGAFLAVSPTGQIIATTTPSGGGGVSLSAANTWSALQLFSAGASSTNFSNFGTAYFGGTATSSFNNLGQLALVSNGLSVGTNQLVVSGGNVGIGTTTPGSILSVQGVANFVSNATSTFYKGINLTAGCFSINGTCISGAGGSGVFTLDGNANLFAGTGAFENNVSGTNNFAAGTNALQLNTTGTDNFAVGFHALNSNDNGTGNFASGFQALTNNISGSNNFAAGLQALLRNTTGGDNTAIGNNALFNNTTGSSNIALGSLALQGNPVVSGTITAFADNGGGGTTVSISGGDPIVGDTVTLDSTPDYDGTWNVIAVDPGVSFDIDTGFSVDDGTGNYTTNGNTGSDNFAAGNSALHVNTTGVNNIAQGNGALFSNTTGTDNIAQGYSALFSNTTGIYNISAGQNALYSNTTGSFNLALGSQAGHDLISGDSNIAVGNSVNLPDSTGSNQLNIGNLIFGTGLYDGGSGMSSSASGGSVGINNNAPAYTLDVGGDINFTGALYNNGVLALGTPTTTPTVVSDASAAVSSAYAVATQGRYAYVTDDGGGELQILDVTNPSELWSIQQVSTSGGTPRALAVSGKYAYVIDAGDSTMNIIDVSNQQLPNVLSSVALTDPLNIAVQGHYAFITDGTDGLVIYDVSDPTNPVLLSSLYPNANSVSAAHGPLFVQGNHVYLGSGNKLFAFDVSDPTNPMQVGASSGFTGNVNSIVVRDGWAYVTAGSGTFSRLYRIQVDDATSLSIVNSQSIPYAYGLYVQGTSAYVTGYNSISGAGYLKTYDISSTSVAPQFLNEYSDSSGDFAPNLNIGAISAQGRFIYVAGGGTFLTVLTTGGSYTQTAEYGALQAGTLSLDSDLQAQSGIFGGGLSVARSTNIGGDLNVTGNIYQNGVLFGGGGFTVDGNQNVFTAGLSTLTHNSSGAYNFGAGIAALTNNTSGSDNFAVGNSALQGSSIVSGTISAFADNGSGGTTVSLSGVDPVVGDSVTISGTSNYDGVWNVIAVNPGVSFDIDDAFSVDDGTGNYVTNGNTGSNNIAQGNGALFSNTTGANNIAQGNGALYFNTTGSDNIASGYQSLVFNTTGTNNIAQGSQALNHNTIGSNNIAQGNTSLFNNTTGVGNFAGGYFSLSGNTTGSYNVALGYFAGLHQTTGSNNIVIGSGGNGNGLDVASTTGSNQLNIGNLIFGTGLDGWSTNISSGSIGIGTTTPGSIFSVQGVANFVSGATSTFYKGINLTAGCFSINGVCIGAGGGGASLSVANTWTALQSFAAGASSTQLSVFGPAYFGGTATSSFNSAGNLTLAGLGTPTGAFLAINPSGQVIATTSPSSGASLSAANTWTAVQTFTSNVAIGTTTVPWASLTVSGSLAADSLILGGNRGSFGSIIQASKGYSAYTNFSGGIGTGGMDSLTPLQRLTSSGNLVNIGSIQGGELNLTSGGTFATKVDYTAGTNPSSVVVADFNGDGKLDYAISNSSSATISVFINQATSTWGGASFAPKVDYSLAAYMLAAGDLNGDGKADLVATSISSFFTVFINNGNGTFATGVTYSSGSAAAGVAVGDLNGDGKADVAVANNGSNTVSVFFNQATSTWGGASFATKVDYATGTGPEGIAIGDVNGDGKADLATANDANTASILLNNGNGTFATKVDYSVGSFVSPNGVTLADLNGDNKLDLAVANWHANLTVLMNQATSTWGGASFAPKVDYTTGSSFTPSVAAGDVNGDGKIDLVAASYGSASASVFINQATSTWGASSLAPKVDYTVGTNPNAVALADFNGDGKADIVSANNGSSNSSVLINNATSILYAKASSASVGVGTTTPFSTLTVGTGNIGAFNGAICADNGGTAKCYGALTAGVVYGDSSSFSASDVAENYPTTDPTLTAGEIISLDAAATSSVKRAAVGEEVFGVVSTAPGVLLGDQGTSSVPVALSGRVPVRVNMEGGPISVGDRITLSSIAGVGKKATTTADVVGIALESYMVPTASSTIVVFVQSRQSISHDQINALAELTAVASSTDPSVSFIDGFFDGIFSRMTAWFANAANGVGDFFANRIHTKQICLSDDGGASTCITKTQLDALLAGAGVTSSGGGASDVSDVVDVPSDPAPDEATSTPEVSSDPDTSAGTSAPESEEPPVVSPDDASSTAE